jgi:hypothetical protein
MAALRGERVELGAGEETGPEDSSAGGAGRRGFDLNALMGELFSKLRAGGLTVAEAAALPRGAEALSFFATRVGSAVLVWGARDVIGTWLKKTLLFTVRSICRNRFAAFIGQRADFQDFAESALTEAIGDDRAPHSLDKVYG